MYMQIQPAEYIWCCVYMFLWLTTWYGISRIIIPYFFRRNNSLFLGKRNSPSLCHHYLFVDLYLGME